MPGSEPFVTGQRERFSATGILLGFAAGADQVSRAVAFLKIQPSRAHAAMAPTA